MYHFIIAAAVLAFAGLDVIFVQFSETPSAALTFAVLAYLILLIMGGAAGSFGGRPEDQELVPGATRRQLGSSGWRAILRRVLLTAAIPVVLLLLLAYIPDLDDPLDPSATVQLGSTFAVFWLLMSLALVGAVLGFLFPRTGAFEAVQLALYTWMVWVTICLIGAWVGLTLRQIGDFYLFRIQDAAPGRQRFRPARRSRRDASAPPANPPSAPRHGPAHVAGQSGP